MEQKIQEIKDQIDIYLDLKEIEKNPLQRHYYLGMIQGLEKSLEILQNSSL